MEIGFQVNVAGEAGINYVPVEPISQYEGVDLYSLNVNWGETVEAITISKVKIYEISLLPMSAGYADIISQAPKTFFKLDANNVPVEIYVKSPSGSYWRSYDEFLSDPTPMRPVIFAKTFGESERQELALNMASSGLFKPKSQYLVVGDEVPGEGVINFKGMLSAEAYDNMKKYLTFMPRQLLRDFFMKKIYPGIPLAGVMGDMREGQMMTDPVYGGRYQFKSYMNMVWAGLVDLFNLGNLEYVNKNQIEPLEWERQKTDAYYTSQSEAEMEALTAELDQYGDVGLALDPKAKAIMDQFEALPKLGDTGFEINRQNAIKELLKRQDYDVAQAIVDAYRYATDTGIGDTLKRPLPGAIMSGNGEVIVQKSTI